MEGNVCLLYAVICVPVSNHNPFYLMIKVILIEWQTNKYFNVFITFIPIFPK